MKLSNHKSILVAFISAILIVVLTALLVTIPQSPLEEKSMLILLLIVVYPLFYIFMGFLVWKFNLKLKIIIIVHFAFQLFLSNRLFDSSVLIYGLIYLILVFFVSFMIKVIEYLYLKYFNQ